MVCIFVFSLILLKNHKIALYARTHAHTRARALINIFTPVIKSFYIRVFTIIVYRSLEAPSVFI